MGHALRKGQDAKITQEGCHFRCEQTGVEHRESAKPPPPAGEARLDHTAGDIKVHFPRVSFTYCPLPPWRAPCLSCCDTCQCAHVPFPAPKTVVSVQVCIELVAFPTGESAKSSPRLDRRQFVPTAEPLGTTRTIFLSYRQHFSATSILWLWVRRKNAK